MQKLYPPATPPTAPAVKAINASRRAWLGGVSGAGLALAAGATSTPARAERVATKAHIVIAGSGLAGLALAHRVGNDLDGAKITVIDAKEVHNYQPGYTLVATGVWPVSKTIDSNADLMPSGVEWVKDMVAEFDPAANAVVTNSGKRISYDYLVVAVGTHQDWGLIEGMDVKAIGQNGLASVYPSSDAAGATWQAMDAFRQKGGGDDTAQHLPQMRWRSAEDDLHAARPLGTGRHHGQVTDRLLFSPAQHL